MENNTSRKLPERTDENKVVVDTESLIDDIESQIDNDPAVVEALRTLQTWRMNPDGRTEEELVNNVKQAREAAENRLVGSEKYKLELTQLQIRKHALDSILQSINGSEDENELLQKLGFLNNEGKFTFPEKLFSPRAKELYDDYLELVVLWVRASENSALLGTDVAEMRYLDRARVLAHNQATQQIYEEMGGALEFAQVRRLIAKMRDMVVPNAGESKTTALAAKQALEKAAEDVYKREEELKKAAA